MGAFIDEADITVFVDISGDRASAYIEDAEAKAVMIAPCLGSPDDLDPHVQDAVKAILREAILRRVDSGIGATVQRSTGPFSQTVTTASSKSLFYPSEQRDLRRLCGGGAFMIDTMPDRLKQ